MKTVFHPSNERGEANHGWLQSRHSFSFANYFDPNKINFGALRVLNDDIVAPKMGFGTHPHENMEIVSIPLKGDLEHQDNMGNTSVIKAGEIQVMSAGTGVLHSEYNKNKDQEVNFLQIWIIPNQKDVAPRYDQAKISLAATKNKLGQILSPNQSDEGVWIYQDAWFHLGEFDSAKKIDYSFHKKANGVYFFVLEGKAKIANEALNTKDAIGIWDTEQVELAIQPNSKILSIEIPMEF
ncbi:MAG: pirin family protein [Bacteroidota bacterium]